MIYDISYKILIGSKSLRASLDKIPGFIRIFDGTKYLSLFGSKKYDAIYNRIRFFLSINSGITAIYFHCYAKIKVDS